jgi:LPXTG-motif cell wall-anchored protein
VTEEDVPIVHTQQENVIWFHTTIIGAPALVLAAGLVSVRRRRKPKGVEA